MLNMMGAHDDDNCSYKKLYEGAQSSLTDMAGKHASALGRIGRLRNSVVQACKNTSPAAFAQLEARMSRRLSDADDQMIVAAVEHLLRESSGSDSTDARTSKELRRLLALRGVVLSGDNPGEWVKQLGGTPVETKPEAFLATELSFFSALARRKERDIDAQVEKAVPTPPPDAWSQAVERLLGKRKTEAQVSAEAALANAEREAEFLAANPDVDSFQDVKPTRKKSGKTSKPRPEPSDHTTQAWPEVSSVSWDDLKDDSATQSQDQTKDNSADTPSDNTPSGNTPLESERKMAPSQPVRVELFPNPNPSSTARKRTRRQPRTHAIPPESFQDAAPAAASVVSLEMLSTVVRSSRPVFTSELAEIAGSEDLFEEWKREQMTDGSTVRFIAPKARHKQRGALVIPVGAARDDLDAKGPSWWSAVLDKWRGAKLYELAVLFSKVSDTVASCHVDDHLPYVNLTLSRDRGVTGIVVLCDDDLSSLSPGHNALKEGLSDMLSKQTELTVVLVTSDKALDEAVSAASSIYKSEGWTANSPVVVARSWEWANDSGVVVEVDI